MGLQLRHILKMVNSLDEALVFCPYAEREADLSPSGKQEIRFFVRMVVEKGQNKYELWARVYFFQEWDGPLFEDKKILDDFQFGRLLFTRASNGSRIRQVRLTKETINTIKGILPKELNNIPIFSIEERNQRLYSILYALFILARSSIRGAREAYKEYKDKYRLVYETGLFIIASAITQAYSDSTNSERNMLKMLATYCDESQCLALLGSSKGDNGDNGDNSEPLNLWGLIIVYFPSLIESVIKSNVFLAMVHKEPCQQKMLADSLSAALSSTWVWCSDRQPTWIELLEFVKKNYLAYLQALVKLHGNESQASLLAKNWYQMLLSQMLLRKREDYNKQQEITLNKQQVITLLIELIDRLMMGGEALDRENSDQASLHLFHAYLLTYLILQLISPSFSLKVRSSFADSFVAQEDRPTVFDLNPPVFNKLMEKLISFKQQVSPLQQKIREFFDPNLLRNNGKSVVNKEKFYTYIADIVLFHAYEGKKEARTSKETRAEVFLKRILDFCLDKPNYGFIFDEINKILTTPFFSQGGAPEIQAILSAGLAKHDQKQLEQQQKKTPKKHSPPDLSWEDKKAPPKKGSPKKGKGKNKKSNRQKSGKPDSGASPESESESASDNEIKTSETDELSGAFSQYFEKKENQRQAAEEERRRAKAQENQRRAEAAKRQEEEKEKQPQAEEAKRQAEQNQQRKKGYSPSSPGGRKQRGKGGKGGNDKKPSRPSAPAVPTYSGSGASPSQPPQLSDFIPPDSTQSERQTIEQRIAQLLLLGERFARLSEKNGNLELASQVRESCTAIKKEIQEILSLTTALKPQGKIQDASLEDVQSQWNATLQELIDYFLKTGNEKAAECLARHYYLNLKEGEVGVELHREISELFKGKNCYLVGSSVFAALGAPPEPKAAVSEALTAPDYDFSVYFPSAPDSTSPWIDQVRNYIETQKPSLKGAGFTIIESKIDGDRNFASLKLKKDGRPVDVTVTCFPPEESLHERHFTPIVMIVGSRVVTFPQEGLLRWFTNPQPPFNKLLTIASKKLSDPNDNRYTSRVFAFFLRTAQKFPFKDPEKINIYISSTPILIRQMAIVLLLTRHPGYWVFILTGILTKKEPGDPLQTVLSDSEKPFDKEGALIVEAKISDFLPLLMNAKIDKIPRYLAFLYTASLLYALNDKNLDNERLGSAAFELSQKCVTSVVPEQHHYSSFSWLRFMDFCLMNFCLSSSSPTDKRTTLLTDEQRKIAGYLVSAYKTVLATISLTNRHPPTPVPLYQAKKCFS